MGLPKALWRYVLTFLELDVSDVLSLAHVSTGWRLWVLSRGMVARCVVDLERLPRAGDAMLGWMSGVVDLMLIHGWPYRYDCPVHFTPAAFCHLAGLRTLTLNTTCCSPERLGDSLAHLTSLCKLDLHYGHHGHLPASPFEHMPPLLQELQLQSCSGLASTALAHLTDLTQLTIIGHDMGGLTDSSFKDLWRLRVLNIRFRKENVISDAAFSHLSCLEELHISRNYGITAAAFVHFTKLHTLNMIDSDHESVCDGPCDASFSNLTRLTKLDMSLCWLPAITGAAFSHLGKLVELRLGYHDDYWQESYGVALEAGFKHLTSLRRLTCFSAAFTWTALAPLAALQSLTFDSAQSERLWETPFPSLPNLQRLNLPVERTSWQLRDAMLQQLTSLTSLTVQRGGQLSDAAFTGCGKLLELDLGDAKTWNKACSISDSAFAHLTSLTRLSQRHSGLALTAAAFRHLAALQALDCSWNHAVTDAWICQLPCLRELRMCGCSQEAITDAAFRHLSLLEVLDIRYCTQPTITDAAFAHLPSLRKLNMTECRQPSITAAVAEHLRHVASVECGGCADEVKSALKAPATDRLRSWGLPQGPVPHFTCTTARD